jgi:hypothetical protein
VPPLGIRPGFGLISAMGTTIRMRDALSHLDCRAAPCVLKMHQRLVEHLAPRAITLETEEWLLSYPRSPRRRPGSVPYQRQRKERCSLVQQ